MLNISVGGDPEGGYLVDVHDGDKRGVYRPQAGDDHAAFASAVKEHDPGLAAAIAKAMGGNPDDEARIAALESDLSAARSENSRLIDELAAHRTPAPAPAPPEQP